MKGEQKKLCQRNTKEYSGLNKSIQRKIYQNNKKD